jgi:hypothetical protein
MLVYFAKGSTASDVIEKINDQSLQLNELQQSSATHASATAEAHSLVLDLKQALSSTQSDLEACREQLKRATEPPAIAEKREVATSPVNRTLSVEAGAKSGISEPEIGVNSEGKFVDKTFRGGEVLAGLIQHLEQELEAARAERDAAEAQRCASCYRNDYIFPLTTNTVYIVRCAS